MKHSMLMAGILAAAATAASARDDRPVDVIVNVHGEDMPPSSVDYGARATLSWIFARIGIRVAWRDGAMRGGEPPSALARIQVRFIREESGNRSPEALAYARPFGEGSTAITIIYSRIRWTARESAREPALLAHVLAHEMGHFLQRTTRHSAIGIMKAHWSAEDYDAMARSQLAFTRDDVELILHGLEVLKNR